MRRELRGLADHRAVDIDRFPSLATDHRRDFFEKRDAVRTLPPLVGIGKVMTDVFESRGAEERVTTCVRDDVSVAVTAQAGCPLEDDASEHERALVTVAVPVAVAVAV